MVNGQLKERLMHFSLFHYIFFYALSSRITCHYMVAPAYVSLYFKSMSVIRLYLKLAPVCPFKWGNRAEWDSSFPCALTEQLVWQILAPFSVLTTSPSLIIKLWKLDMATEGQADWGNQNYSSFVYDLHFFNWSLKASIRLNKKIKSKYSFVKPGALVRAIHFHVSFKSKICCQAWLLL